MLRFSLWHETRVLQGQKAAVKYVEEGYDWVVDIDLENYFGRVSHQRLMSSLARRVPDKSLLVLIGRMLRARVVMPDGIVLGVEEGVPQGGPLSPLLSNIVLDELDRELATRGHRFVRYADDCNIYVLSERSGQRVMESVKSFLEWRMRLKVNEKKSAVARPEERHFLGFCLRREPLDGSAEVLLSERSKERIDGKIRELTRRSWGDTIESCIAEINVYTRGWMGFFGICTIGVERLLSTLDARIRRRLRAIQLKQWKRRRTIVRKLIQLRARKIAAWRSIYSGGMSLWVLSHTTRRRPFTSQWPLDCTRAEVADGTVERVSSSHRCPGAASAVPRIISGRASGWQRGVTTRCPEEPDVKSTSPVL